VINTKSEVVQGVNDYRTQKY